MDRLRNGQHQVMETENMKIGADYVAVSKGIVMMAARNLSTAEAKLDGA